MRAAALGLYSASCSAAATTAALRFGHALCEDAPSESESGSLLDTASVDDDTFGLLKETVQEMKAPAPFERWADDVKRLTHVGTFAGAKLDLSKPLTTNFQVSHRVQLGGSPYGPQANEYYQFGAQFFNDSVVAMSTVDQMGMVEAQLIMPSLPFADKKLSSKVITVFQPEAKHDMMWVDLDYTGETSVGSFRAGKNVQGMPGPLFGVSYSQAVTPQLSMAGEAQFLVEGSRAITGSTVKYETPKWTAISTWQLSPGQGGDMHSISAMYHRKVMPNRVNLATELTVSPTTLDSQVALGADFQLRQGSVSAAIDGSGKMSSVIQTRISPGMNLTFSAEAQFGAGAPDPATGAPGDSYKFGYGLQIGN